jgi:hypothetical protein
MTDPPPHIMTKNPGGTMTNHDTCPDCGAPVNAPHTDGCDVARCLHDGGQRLMHEIAGGSPTVVEIDGELIIGTVYYGHDCGRDVWTGLWPGEAECAEFGWWVQDRCDEGLGFVPCAPDAPGATQDLNRLYRDARWDRAAGRWRRRGDLVR